MQSKYFLILISGGAIFIVGVILSTWFIIDENNRDNFYAIHGIMVGALLIVTGVITAVVGSILMTITYMLKKIVISISIVKNEKSISRARRPVILFKNKEMTLILLLVLAEVAASIVFGIYIYETMNKSTNAATGNNKSKIQNSRITNGSSAAGNLTQASNATAD